MEVLNNSNCDVQVTQAVDKTGQPWLVIIAKGGYALPDVAPATHGPLRPLRPTAAEPLLLTDLFVGEPGLSAPLVEGDMAPYKQACDVIFKGSAHAPWRDGQAVPQAQLDVCLDVSDGAGRPLLSKALRVYGERFWRQRGRWELTPPQSFVEQPLHYGMAFGSAHDPGALGTPLSDAEVAQRAHPMNLVGRGHGAGPFARLLDNAPAHQTELWVDGKLQSIAAPTQPHPPAGFGPLARGWQPRLPLAGTYDDAWKDEVFPLLPADFDDAFYQCAPQDQQMPYPRGGEVVTLTHLTRAGAREAERTKGRYRFKVPARALPVAVLTKARDTLFPTTVIDTLVVDADAMRLDMVWRARMPLKRSLHEVHTVAVGAVSRRWWQSRVAGNAGCVGCGEDSAPSPDEPEKQMEGTPA